MKNLYSKKKTAYTAILLVLMLLVSSCAGFAQEVASVDFSEENPLLGWEVMNISNASSDTGADINYVKNPRNDDENDKCLNIHIRGKDNSDELLYPFIQKSFSTGTAVEISYEFRITNENAKPNLPFYRIVPLWSLTFDTGSITFLTVDQEGNLKSQDNGAEIFLKKKIENDKAYKLKAVFTISERTFDVYLDDVKLNAQPLVFGSNIKGNFKHLRILNGGVKGYDYYFDDIKIETYYPMEIVKTTDTENTPVDSFTVNFTNSIDTERFSESCISVTKDGEKIPFTYIINENVLRIDYKNPLEYETDYKIRLCDIYDTDGRAVKEKIIDLRTQPRPPFGAQISGFPMTMQRIMAKHNSESECESIVWLKSTGEDGEYTEFSSRNSIVLGEELKNMFIKAQLNFSDGTETETLPFGPILPNGNIALGAAAEADSSINSMYAPKNMTDGNDDTRWAGASKSGYITFELYAAAQFNACEFDSFGSRFKNYTLECSNDKMTWTTLSEENAEFISPNAKKTYRHEFNTANAKYFRIKYEAFPEVDGASIWELRLFNDSAVCPVITQSYISGELSAGSVITAECDSKSADTEFSYAWEKADEKNGTFLPIENMNTKSITIPKDCVGKYIRVNVSAKNKDGQFSSFSQSEPIGAVETAKPSAPYAYGIKMTGNAYTDETVEFTYMYDDVNDDAEDNSLYEIIVSKNKDMSGETVVKSGTAMANDKITYTVTSNDADKYIALRVTPVSINEPKTGIPVTGESVFVRDIPRAENVQVQKSADGRSIVGSYTYSHKNGDGEKNSVYKWYRADSKNGNFEEIANATEKSYRLTSSDYGKYFKFEVTPKCENEPSTGKTVLSEALHIAKKSDSSSGGGSSSGGSGGGGYINKDITVGTDTKKDDDTKAENKEIFSDIKNHWAKDSIESLYKLGVIKGTGEEKFEPERAVTKAELTAVLVRTFDISGEKEFELTDISENDWFYNEVVNAAKSGIISGYNGKFFPNDSVTREQAAKIIAEIYYMKKPPLTYSAPDADFKDIGAVSAWAKDYVNACVKYELMNGMTSEYFAPSENITRAQMAVLVKRLTDKILAED